MIYHVAKTGDNHNCGSEEAPFLTIQKAAEAAWPGDTVVVHEGEYREWVRPVRGGISDSCRITYMAARGERVVIKGSERVDWWERIPEGETVWKAVLPDSMFGDWNPYRRTVWGDWVVDPRDYEVHLGEVYLNGKSFYEAQSLEDVLHPRKRQFSAHETWMNRRERILEQEMTIYQWYCKPEENQVIVYANFHGADPNRETVEVNVRKCCFFPEVTGCGYITVRGFELSQAASPWAPPTAAQFGLIGPNWSKGWLIEENRIHDAKCSGVCLGKEVSTGDNEFTKRGFKPGYQYQLEAVFRARQQGWDKEHVGSHTVRHNVIYSCGQNGIVGHLGCIFSEIYENEIFDIAKKHEYYGHEIAGIKLHAAIDVQIVNNYIHDCSLGTWLDWQAQGTRVGCNVYWGNDRDLMVEVTHGPYLVDNNIFTSPFSLVNAAQGGAYVHNLICGFIQHYPVLDRATPYHFPHSTEILGTAVVYGADDRWYQNIFLGGEEAGVDYGTAWYDGCPVSAQEYMERVAQRGVGDLENFLPVPQPVYIDGNVYLHGAQGFKGEEHGCSISEDPKVRVSQEAEGLYLEITLPEAVFDVATEAVDTNRLGLVRIPEAAFEGVDARPMTLALDLLGSMRGEKPVPGPLQELRPGRNRICLWQRDSF